VNYELFQVSLYLWIQAVDDNDPHVSCTVHVLLAAPTIIFRTCIFRDLHNLNGNDSFCTP